eukprot:Nk52_evm6s564 gene=Nk52_evmTU6s564
MMNNKIPVALVFCLVAVSVSLAQPFDGQGVPKGWKTCSVKWLRLRPKEGPRSWCYLTVFECKFRKYEGNDNQQNCDIGFNPKYMGNSTDHCPKPSSKFITVKRTGSSDGDDQWSYSGLQLHPLKSEQGETYEPDYSKWYVQLGFACKK